MSLVLIALTDCGGGKGSTQTGPVSSTISSVAPACTPSTVAANATSQCSATVMGTGSYSSAVTWSASAGTINSSGLFTAPATAGTAMVTAISTQDSAKAGTASVTAQASSSSSTTSVQAACNPSTVIATATSQCIATVKGTGSYSSAVTWSASVGAINAGGLFNAPATTGAATIKATSVQDTAQSGQATVTVQTPPPPQPPPQTRHIVMVIEENTGYAGVVSNSDWPNLNSLISNGALATNYYANSHPSIGNYFMLTTGQLLTTDDNSTQVWDVDNLARRMLAAGIPFRIYAEGIAQGYVGGNIGTYLIRHNPFAMLSDIANNPQVANQTIWPFTQFATDLANGALPEFSFAIPDVNDDAHDGTPQQADSWLETNIVTRLSNYPAFQSGGDGVLIVAFDEGAASDTTNGGGHVAAVFWGPIAKVGFQTSSTVYQHQSILLAVMEALGLPNAPGAAATAPSVSEFLK